MKAIDFVVRNDVGALQRGSVPADGLETVVTLSGGLSVSLNLDAADIATHERVGNDLVMTLADGRLVRLENFFDDAVAPNKLFLSTDGTLTDVLYVETADGALIAQYGETQEWGKWSAADDLIFLGRSEVAAAELATGEDEQVSMLAAGAALLGGAGAVAAGGAALAGLAVLGATAGDGGTSADNSVVASVDDADVTFAVGGDSAADGFAVTGQGSAGDQVEVTVGGETQTTVVGDDGSWGVGFSGDGLPDDGVHTAAVTVTNDAGGSVELSGPTYEIDTVAGLAIDEVGDGVINAEEAAEGLTLTGSADPGSQVEVQFGDAVSTVTTGDDGVWTATFLSSDIPGGEAEVAISATATDALGNSATATTTVSVDQIVNSLEITSSIGGADGVLNAKEAASELVVSGVAEPGATVTLSLAGASVSAVADEAGDWTASFPAGAIETGTYSTVLQATAIDLAGNTRSLTQAVTVDTEASILLIDTPVAGDGVINEAELADGIMLSGTAEPGAVVAVSLAGVSHEVVTQDGGTWQAFFASGDVQPGVYDAEIVATTTDAAGNTATTSDSVRVDTRVETLSLIHDAGDDNVVNADEASDGITLSGQTEPGSTIAVDFAGTSYAGSVDAAGNWSLEIPPADIASGSYTAEIVVSATDAAGNSDTITSSLQIDTEAPEGPVIESFTRDTDGIRGISVEQSEGDLSVARVEGDTIEAVDNVQTDIDALGETNIAFVNDVPDGSHLVVNASDAAGNTRGTYVVLDDETTGSAVNIGTTGLGNYNIEAIDLQFAEEANLSITEAQLVALSDTSDTVVITGGVDDKVVLDGAIQTGSAAGQDIYTLGAGTVIIDDDIQVGGVV